MKAFSVTTYTALRKKVEEILLTGQRKIEEARVHIYWNTGRLIDEHIRKHTPNTKERAVYNSRIVEKLSRDLEISDTVLYRCVRFAQRFKKVAARPLSWAHYRTLIAVPDEKRRLALADEASKGAWSSRELEIEVRNFLWDKRVKASEGEPPALLPVPVLGSFYTYQVTNLDEFSKTRRIVVGARATTIQPESIHPEIPSRVLDVGFSFKKDMSLFPSCRLPAGTVVASTKDANGHYALRPQTTDNGPQQSSAASLLLYTYKAYVKKVIDGDTLKVELDIGFGDWHGETIRLKGIDCPEVNTSEGKAAKRFVERELGACEFITVKSTQTRKEKWGRYLGDIFYQDKSGKQVYLNNLLLENGHAVRVRG